MKPNCATLNVATSNISVNAGKNKTTCSATKPIKNANQVYLFENTPMAKIDCLDLELKPCISRDKHKVVKAIVLAVNVSPVDKPISKATAVAIAINKPSSITWVVNILFNNGV